MDRKFTFTQARLSKLAVPEKGRVTYRDTKVPGLCIRVTEKGAMSAYLSRKVNGRHVKFRLGTWPDDFGTVKVLRDAATDKLAEGLENVATQRRQKRHEPTVSDLWDCWAKHMEAHKKPKSRAEDKRQYKAFLERWATRPLSSIGRPDVAKLHAKIGRERGRYAANRLLALVSAMYSEGQRAGLVSGENPCRGIRRFREEKRDRWLDEDELRRFFRALHAEPPLFRDYFTLLLLTGARKSNLLTIRWADLDLNRGLWRIPETKSGDVVVIPLVGPAVEILLRRKGEANGSEWVFASHSKTGHLQEPKTAWARICRRAGLENARVHDVRRTLGSWLTVGGSSLPVVGKALGHKSLQATEVYARLGTDTVREALETTTAKMLALRPAQDEPETEGPAHDE